MLTSTHRLALYSFILCACASSVPSGNRQQAASLPDTHQASGSELYCVNNGKLGACLLVADSSESRFALFDITMQAQKGHRRPTKHFSYSLPVATLRLIDNCQLPLQPLPANCAQQSTADSSLLTFTAQQQTAGTIAQSYQQGTEPFATAPLQTAGMIMRRYKRGTVVCQQECFASWRDKTVVFHLESSRPQSLNFEIALSSDLPHRLKTTQNQFTLMGHVPTNEATSAIHFCANLLVRATDGDVVVTDSTLQLVNVSEATLFFICETSYGEGSKTSLTSTAPYLANLSDDAWHLFNYDYKALKARFLQSQ